MGRSALDTLKLMLMVGTLASVLAGYEIYAFGLAFSEPENKANNIAGLVTSSIWLAAGTGFLLAYVTEGVPPHPGVSVALGIGSALMVTHIIKSLYNLRQPTRPNQVRGPSGKRLAQQQPLLPSTGRGTAFSMQVDL